MNTNSIHTDFTKEMITSFVAASQSRERQRLEFQQKVFLDITGYNPDSNDGEFLIKDGIRFSIKPSSLLVGDERWGVVIERVCSMCQKGNPSNALETKADIGQYLSFTHLCCYCDGELYW